MGRWRWPHVLGALLVLSLALNLFLSGWVASGWWHQAWGPPPPGGLVERIASRLSPEDALILRRAFAALPDPGQDDRALHARVEAALRAEPFDPAALDDAMDKEFAGHDAFGRGLRQALVKAAERMSPEGRQVLADQLRHPPPPPR